MQGACLSPRHDPARRDTCTSSPGQCTQPRVDFSGGGNCSVIIIFRDPPQGKNFKCRQYHRQSDFYFIPHDNRTLEIIYIISNRRPDWLNRNPMQPWRAGGQRTSRTNRDCRTDFTRRQDSVQDPEGPLTVPSSDSKEFGG